MANSGDRVEVASTKGKARTGRVIATSGLMLTIRWESGDESSLIPGPGTLTILSHGRPLPLAKTAAPAKKAARKVTAKKATAPARRTVRKVAVKKTAAPARRTVRKVAVKKTAAPAKKTVRKVTVKKASPAVKRTAKKAPATKRR